jgi:hypothetical protein
MATPSGAGGQRNLATWISSVVVVVSVVALGVWLGAAAQRRSFFPTLMSWTKSRFLEVRTAVRDHLGVARTAVNDGSSRPSDAHGRAGQRRLRVVPMRPVESSAKGPQ